jgi:RNA ligase (TIGR02306 family)
MSERKLDSVRVISDIRPILGADKIELAIVDGWQSIVRKGAFKANDKCVYIEIDSLLPLEERYSFLERYKKVLPDGTEGYRVKSIKMKNTLSQGLIFSFEELALAYNIDIGTDVSSLLNVRLYEANKDINFGKSRGNFPSFLIKTDAERVQNLVRYLPELQKYTYEMTKKLDGTSASYYYYQGKFGICSRNLEIDKSDKNVYYTIAEKYHLEELLEFTYNVLDRSLAIQGEIVGPGVNKNRLHLPELDFYIFDIYDIEKRQYLSPVERRSLYRALLTRCSFLKHVPIIEQEHSIISLEAILTLADGTSRLSYAKREGLVFKSNSDSCRLIFKAISNDYLLKEE